MGHRYVRSRSGSTKILEERRRCGLNSWRGAMSSGKAARRAAAEAALEPPAPDLTERFPVCRWLAGEVRFAALAHGFAELCRSRSLLAADDVFGAFIDGFQPTDSLAYLADVARLEAAPAGCAVAANPASLGPGELAGVPFSAWEEA